MWLTRILLTLIVNERNDGSLITGFRKSVFPVFVFTALQILHRSSLWPDISFK